jgi:hypothetical protein
MKARGPNRIEKRPTGRDVNMRTSPKMSPSEPPTMHQTRS